MSHRPDELLLNSSAAAATFAAAFAAARLGQTPNRALYSVSMGGIRCLSARSMYGARGVANTSFLAKQGKKSLIFGSGTQFYVQMLFFWHSGGVLCPFN